MLKIEDLTCSYIKKKEVLHGISLELPSSSIGVLLGPNGSGKSTLIKAMCGILKPSRGAIRLDGSDLLSISPKERAKMIAYVPQVERPSSTTVWETVMMGRIPHIKWKAGPSDIEAVKAVIEELGLADMENEPVCSISGGQMQLAMIARALASGAKTILLDEPTNNLDIAHQRCVANALKKLAEDDGVSILLATHDISLALELGDAFFLMKDGAILHRGDFKAITAELLKEVYGAGFQEFNGPKGQKTFIGGNT